MVGCGDATPRIVCELYCDNRNGKLSYVGLAENTPQNASAISRASRYVATLGRRTVAWLDEQATKPSHVICYGTSVSFLCGTSSWCRKNSVPLIADVVEWHDPWIMRGGMFSPMNISDKTSLRYIIPRVRGIVAISSFLEQFYLARSRHVIRIPTILDTCQFTVRPSSLCKIGKTLTLAYAGIPGNGRKDLINTVIEAVLRLNSSQESVRFVMAGPTPHEVLCLPALSVRKMTSLPPCIEARGRQTSDKALDIVRSADFTPLLRPLKRFAQAGFPTKFPESLAVGTPVICNVTSDLGKYIQDGIEGFVCSDNSVGAFIENLICALKMSPDEYVAMRKAARERAEKSFDYHVHAERLGRFLESVSCT